MTIIISVLAYLVYIFSHGMRVDVKTMNLFGKDEPYTRTTDDVHESSVEDCRTPTASQEVLFSTQLSNNVFEQDLVKCSVLAFSDIDKFKEHVNKNNELHKACSPAVFRE